MNNFVRDLSMNADKFKEVSKQIQKIQKQQLDEFYQNELKAIDKKVSKEKDIWKKKEMELKLQSQLDKQIKKREGMLKSELKIFEKQAFFSGSMLDKIKKFKSELSKAKGASEKMGVVKEFLGSTGGLKTVAGAAGIGALLMAVNKMGEGIEKFRQGLSKLVGFDISLNPLVAVFQILWKSISELWEYTDKRIMPLVAKSNKAYGNMGSQLGFVRKEAISVGNQFVLMGYSFEQGSEAVLNFASAFKQFSLLNQASPENKQLVKLGVKMTEFLGGSSEQAAGLAMAFDRTGSSIKKLNIDMSEAEIVAKSYGVIPNQIRKDMLENIDILQMYGVQNVMQFNKASAVARNFGFTIKEVNAVFGKNMDTFEGTSEAAAKLNTVLGTNVNSFELMMEQDPANRMLSVMKSVKATGKSWEGMSRAMKGSLMNILPGVNEETMALMFSQKNLNKSTKDMGETLKKNLADQDKQKEANKNWESSIKSMNQTLINWQEQMSRIFRIIGGKFIDFVNVFLDKKISIEGAAGDIKGVFNAIETVLNNFDAAKFANNLIGALDKISNSKGGRILKWLFKPEEDQSKLSSVQAVAQGHAELKLMDSLDTLRQGNTEALMTQDYIRKRAKNLIPGAGAQWEDQYDFAPRAEVVNSVPNPSVLATKTNNQTPTANAKNVAGNTGNSGKDQIIQVNLLLDSKKISEQIVKTSRY